MSFGRAYRPTSAPLSPTTATSQQSQSRSSTTYTARPTKKVDEEKSNENDVEWMKKSAVSARNTHLSTKWTPKLDGATLEKVRSWLRWARHSNLHKKRHPYTNSDLWQFWRGLFPLFFPFPSQLLSRRLSASLTPTSPLTIDASYSKLHNTPFHSIRQVRPSSWEKPLVNHDIPIPRLALIERPDLEVANQRHASTIDDAAERRRHEARQQSFLFREARIASLHQRKMDRIQLEERASLRASLDASDPSAPVTSVDAPQYATVPVPPPLRESWNSAHHLAHELEDHPYQPPAHLTQRAIEAIDSKLSTEFIANLERRRNETNRRQEIHQLEERLRQSNIDREHMLNVTFESREHFPQNIDAHLAYLTSSRCAERPPAARPISVETFRSNAPWKTTKLAHVSQSGTRSLRLARAFTASRRMSATSTSTSITPRFNMSAAASARRSSTSSISSSSASTYRSSLSARSHTSRSSTYQHHHNPSHRPSVPLAHRDASRINESGLTSFVDTVAQEGWNQNHADGSGSDGDGDVDGDGSEVDIDGSDAASSPVSSSRRSAFEILTSNDRLALSPRSSSRLGSLVARIPAPLSSARLEELAQPLIRETDLKPIDHAHRDFRGLGVEEFDRRVEAERLQVTSQQMSSESPSASSPSPSIPSLSQSPPPSSAARSSSPRPSALSSRPSTGRSQFVRASYSVRSPTPSEIAIAARPRSSSTEHRPSPPEQHHVPLTARDTSSTHSRASSSTSGYIIHQDTDRLPMWSRTNRLLKYVGELPNTAR